jgi:hypothetical protein
VGSTVAAIAVVGVGTISGALVCVAAGIVGLAGVALGSLPGLSAVQAAPAMSQISSRSCMQI